MLESAAAAASTWLCASATACTLASTSIAAACADAARASSRSFFASCAAAAASAIAAWRCDVAVRRRSTALSFWSRLPGDDSAAVRGSIWSALEPSARMRAVANAADDAARVCACFACRARTSAAAFAWSCSFCTPWEASVASTSACCAVARSLASWDDLLQLALVDGHAAPEEERVLRQRHLVGSV